ncbi:MAG: tetratricopeptide repeat protein [Deltaproteobacteria bacterium]|nr:tetratricopeptide repeat protein [Deltaproteobacteria bacterium]
MRRMYLCIVVLLLAVSGFAETKPEAVLRKEAGNEFLKRREYARARDEYLAALKIDPTYEDAHYNLGVVYFFRLQDYPRALYHLVTYARLAKDAPDLSQVRSLVSQALEKIEEPEREAYAKALAEGTAAALRTFADKYPMSPYVADAKVKVRQLEAFEEQLRQGAKAEEGAYAEALAKGTPEALDSFLAAHPAAPQAAEARRRREQWAEDEKALGVAVSAGTIEALERFLAERPQSPYGSQVQTRIQGLKAEDEAYKVAVGAQSAAAVEQYLKTYPDSPKASDARKVLESLRQAETEARARAEAEAKAKEAAARAEAEARAVADGAWAGAEKANTAEAYVGFAETYPGHPSAAEARKRAAALRAEQTPPAPARPEAPAAVVPAAPVPAEVPAAAVPAAPVPAEVPAAAVPAAPVPAEVPAAAVPAAPTPPEVPAAAVPPAPVPAAVPSAAVPVPVPGPAATPGTDEERLRQEWAATRAKDTQEAYEAFLQLHPEGEEAEAARRRLQELTQPYTPLDRQKVLDRYRKMIQGK